MPATLDFSAHGELVEPLDFSQGGELVADGPPKLPLADFLANLSPQDRARQADLARMESESPAQAFGKAMGKAGRGLYNVAQAYGFEAVGDPEDQAKQLGVSDPALKKAGLLTEPSPSEGGRPSDQGIAALPGAGKVLAKGARGLVETAPQLAAVAGAQAMGVPAPLAAAAVFGSTEEGFSPEQAAVAAALPFVGKYSGRIIGALAKKLGVSGERALQLWKSAGAMAGAAGYLAAIDESKIQNLPTEQRDQARIDMVAGLIGQSVLGPMGVEKEPARAGTADIKPPMPRAMEPAKAGTPSPEVTPDAEIQAGINKALVEAPQPKEPDATQAGQQQESISGKREGDEAQRPPAETSAGGGVQPATESPPAQGAEGDVLLNIQKLARLPAGEFGGAFAAKENAYELGDRARTAEHLAALRSAAENAAREFSSASLQAAKEKFQSDPHNQVMNLAQKKKQFFDEAVRAAAPQVAAEQSGWKYQGVNYGGNINERDPGFGDWYERMLKQEAEGEKKVERLWEFTDHRQGSPTEGITTYVDEGASHEAIVDALKNKTAEVLAAKARHVTAEQVTQLDPNKVPPTQVNPKEVFLSPDVPNFKRAADPETGLVPGQQLQGEYSHSPVNALIVWRRKNGRLEIVTGRHRLDLAQRNHEPAVYVQVMDESAGYTLKNALMADAEANIKDGNGEVEDYANYFRHNPGLAREAAQVKGLFSRAKGRDGWTLGRDASDDLYAAYQAGKTTEAQALEIARAATGNAAAQQIGLKFALQGKPPEFLANVVKAAMSESGGRERALDLFGRDDSAMRAMEEQAKRAGTLQADLRAQIAAASGAAKNPEAARKLGVDVNDPASVKARVQQLRGELVRWENWPLHPDLVAKVKGVSAPASEKPAPETPAPVAPAPKLGSGQKQGDLIASTQREDLSLAGEKGTDAERLAAEKARSEKSAAEARALAEKQQQPLAGMGAAVPGEFTAGAHTATGIKNATVDSERARRGLPPAMEPARRSFGKVWDEAMALVDHDPAAQDNLIDELRTKPRALTDLEDALLLHRQLDLQNDYGKATRDLAQAFDDGRAEDVEREKLRVAGLSDRLLALYDLGKAAGTETGRGLNARKMMAYEDFTLAKMMLDKRSANNGKPLTADQQQELTAAHEKIAATQKAFDEYRAAAESRQAETAANQAVTEMKAETAREPRGRGSRPQPTPEDLAASIRNRLEKGADVTELGTLIQRLARAFVRAGVKERVPLVDAVHGVLKPLLPDLEWRETQDAISGYGDFRQLSQDEISKQLRDLKGQMQQTSKLLDLFQREPPSKTGFERRTPTDVERRLIQQVNEAKKRFGVETTDPAAQLKSALQSVKTRLRNQIADLEDQIRTKTKTVSDRAPAPEDAESQGLKARRDELKKEFDEIFGRPELTDEQRVKRALAGVERQSAEIERQIKEGDIFPGRPSRTPTTPELAAARANRDALVSQRDYLRESIQPTERLTPEQRTLKALKTRLAKRTAELQAKLAAGDFSTRARRTVALDAEGLRLKALNEKAKTDFQRGLVADRLKNRTRLEKFQDTFVKWRRAGLLSSPITLAKLTMAAAQRFAFTPLEEAAGGLISQAVPQLAERAPSEGGFNARAEARALTEGLTTGMADAAQILRTGHSDLERVHGNISPLPREWIDFIGELHGALKAPVLRNAFARSFEKRSAFAIRNGVDVSDPLVQTRLAAEAFQDARRAIFMQDNRVVNAYKAVLGRLEAKSKVTGRTPTAGKIGATVARTLLPIVKVPTNIVAETMQYAAGSVTGSARLANAFRKGIETLPPEHADLIMRELKKGSLGAAVMLLGFLAPTAVGGYYQAGEKRKAADVKAGSIQAFGVNVPGFLLHNPLLETAQLGATVRRVADSKLNKHDRERQGITEGLLAGALGLAEDAPFVRDMVETSKAFNPHERGAFFGELGKSFVPQVAQWAARELDKDQQGRKLNRQPKTALQRVESGIPGLRQNVPINRKQPFQTP